MSKWINIYYVWGGGKDSTALLIYLIENNYPLDDIIYCDLGDWVWTACNKHIQQLENTFHIHIQKLDCSSELQKGFEKWGFPSFINRWCTGIKREAINKYLKRYDEFQIVEYIGYTFDEQKRANKKLGKHKYVYPLIENEMTSTDCLKLCEGYGFDFGGVYNHHSHFNCWCCPLQKIGELRYIYENESEMWDKLRCMQNSCCGYFSNGKSIFEYEHKFWKEKQDELYEVMMKRRGR